MAPNMGKGGQIWLKCITGDLIMKIRDKNNIFERVKKSCRFGMELPTESKTTLRDTLNVMSVL